MEVFVFSELDTIRFTKEGAIKLAIENGYRDLQESYDADFHYFTELEPEDVDNFLFN